MNKTPYFKTSIGRQTLSGAITLGSLPVLLFSRNGGTMNALIGLLALSIGLLSVPVMTPWKKVSKLL